MNWNVLISGTISCIIFFAISSQIENNSYEKYCLQIITAIMFFILSFVITKHDKEKN